MALTRLPIPNPDSSSSSSHAHGPMVHSLLRPSFLANPRFSQPITPDVLLLCCPITAVDARLQGLHPAPQTESMLIFNIKPAFPSMAALEAPSPTLLAATMFLLHLLKRLFTHSPPTFPPSTSSHRHRTRNVAAVSYTVAPPISRPFFLLLAERW
ncbi:hypothetical protein CPB84DRAFT_1849601 [Gymnopilus junonius]|uniref:Uncharacterized protein n=1 Tax=Gymnopilus junonius TaxID=109634 RepID=A0A9P5NG00_GYMJU|nr:hypothetical protein CPB84DRAFT_1849601 [Gymnopilus junonius]